MHVSAKSNKNFVFTYFYRDHFCSFKLVCEDEFLTPFQINSLTGVIFRNPEKIPFIKTLEIFSELLSLNLKEIEQITCTQQDEGTNRCSFFALEFVSRSCHEKHPTYTNLSYINQDFLSYLRHLLKMDMTNNLKDFLTTETEENIDFDPKAHSTEVKTSSFTEENSESQNQKPDLFMKSVKYGFQVHSNGLVTFL